MTILASAPCLPKLRPNLVLQPVGADGRLVVKNQSTDRYFTLPAEEAFLLTCLDGIKSRSDIVTEFEERFGEAIGEEDVDGFVEMAREQGLIESVEDGDRFIPDESLLWALRAWPIPGADLAPEPPAEPAAKKKNVLTGQSILYLRVPLYDPSRLFERLEPRIGFLWTPGFLAASALLVALATLVVWTDQNEFVNRFTAGWGWQTLLLGWAVLAVTTTAHEFAHGLTCKRFGGEVRDVGFLLMYFMPCFYCNVSDAWLFTERSRRLWVTLAGGCCDLILWAGGVLVWRVAQPGTVVHDTGWLVASICGFRLFFNVNPLMKLDGYYLLGDFLGIHNLRVRGRDRYKGTLRWLLWGAARPEPEPHGRFLLLFGFATWCFSLMFLSITIGGLAIYLSTKATALGLAWTFVMGGLSARRLLLDVTKGEVVKMIRTRQARAAAWGAGLAALLLVLTFVQVNEKAGATFFIRPVARAEVRAPVAGFLKNITADEGAVVAAGQTVARLEIPDLESKLTQKHAERRESLAKLAILKIGPRPEVVAEQVERVQRARSWRDLAEVELDRAKTSYSEELIELDAQMRQFSAELERAGEALRRDRALLARQALQVDQLHESEKTMRVAEAQLAQAQARRRARVAEGTIKAEAELARRQTEFADAEAALRLLEVGSRPEEIEAEAARLARIQEEVDYMEEVRGRLNVISPVGGVVTTPRLRERMGQHLNEGDLICEVEAPEAVELEVVVSEQDVARVRPGQTVELKVRALPFQVFRTTVNRIAPRSIRAMAPPGASSSDRPTERAGVVSATDTTRPGTFLVYCRLDDSDRELKSGMTGYARVVIGPTPLGRSLYLRVLRLVRTEYWW